MLCLLPLLVAGCASGSGGGQTAASSAGSSSAQPDATTGVPSGEDALLITVDAGDGTVLARSAEDDDAGEAADD